MFTFQTIKDLRTFLILWFSQTVSELGTAMTDYALVIWVYEQKGTASSVTILTLCIGIVQSSVSVGLLIGSIIATVMKPAKRKCRFVFITCALIFTGNIINSLTISPVIWCISNIGTYVTAVIMNVNLTTVMREKVPVEMQGRVTSAQDTLKNCTIPLGLFLGGILADHVFEPFMKNENFLSGIFGTGQGAGIALIFFISGLAGMIISLIRLTKPVYKELDQ